MDDNGIEYITCPGGSDCSKYCRVYNYYIKISLVMVGGYYR